MDLASFSTREIPAMSVTAPVSLFTSISVTSAVSGRRASRTAWGLTAPVSSGGSSVTSQPSRESFSRGRRTASCSVREDIMCRPFRFCSSAAPKMAQLSLSVPPEVNTSSDARQPSGAATRRRA